MLLPRWAHPTQSVSSGSITRTNNSRLNNTANLHVTGTHNSLGQEMCRNFNRLKGCQRGDCKFSHSCNRKTGNRICGKPHPGHMHDSSEK